MKEFEPKPKLPAVTVATCFHRHFTPPEIGAIEDLEETFLFRVPAGDSESAEAASFWLMHGPTTNLWALCLVPRLRVPESIVAWCSVDDGVSRDLIAELLLLEWQRACLRNGSESHLGPPDTDEPSRQNFSHIVAAAHETQETPLHVAARAGDTELAEVVIRAGASVDVTDAHGRGPLHHAVLARKYFLGSLLLRAGASQDLRDKDGATPADLASDYHDADFLQILKEFGRTRDPAHGMAAEAREVYPNDAWSPTTATGESHSAIPDLMYDLAAHWHREGEYVAARLFFDRLMTMQQVPDAIVCEAILGSILCRVKLGELSSVPSAIKDAIQQETYPAIPFAQLLLEVAERHLRHDDLGPAMSWLQAVTAKPGLPAHIVSMAWYRIAQCQDREGDTQAAIQSLTRALGLDGLSRDEQLKLSLRRGILNYQEGHTEAAIADLTRVIEAPVVSRRQRTRALVQRANCYEELGRPQSVIADLTAAAEMGEISLRSISASLHNFGCRSNLRQQAEKAFEYFSAVIEIGAGDGYVLSNALVNRGCHFGTNEDYEAATSDFKQAIGRPDIPAKVLARAYYNLGNVRRLQGHFRMAMAHFDRVIDMRRAGKSTVAAAYCRRALCWEQLKDNEAALRDLSRSLAISKADDETIAVSLLWTGICQDRLGDADQAIAHFRRLIDMPTASEEMRARARWGLGEVLCGRGEKAAGREFLEEARQIFTEIGRSDLVAMVDNSVNENLG